MYRMATCTHLSFHVLLAHASSSPSCIPIRRCTFRNTVIRTGDGWHAFLIEHGMWQWCCLCFAFHVQMPTAEAKFSL